MSAGQIPVLEGEPGRSYEVVGEVRARAGALTPFNKRPTPEQLQGKLRNKAKKKGATAVINVSYKAGIIPSSWKGLTATGTGVRFT